MALSISDILTAIRSGLEIQSEENITRLSKDVQLEAMKNYAEEIKPSIFYNTDIGNIINSHIDILSYYLPSFLLNSISPIYGYEYITNQTTRNTWVLNFSNQINSTIESSDILDNNYIEVETIRKISDVTIEKLDDTIYYDIDYVLMSAWKVSWNYNGIESFDVYYKFGSNASVLMYSEITTDWCNFALDQSILDLFTSDNNVQFIIESHEDPTVYVESKLFDVDGVSSGSETVVDVEIARSSTEFDVVIDNKQITLQKTVDLDILPRDYQSITINKELIDVNNVYFNEYQDYNSYFITFDKFKIESTNIIDGSIADPNQIIILFNIAVKTGQTLSTLLPLYGSADGIIEVLTSCNYRLSNHNYNIIIEIDNPTDKIYKYYRLAVGNVLDVYNQTVSQSGTNIEFENNHGFVYDEYDNILIDELDQMFIVD